MNILRIVEEGVEIAVKKLKRLSEAEAEVMQVIWDETSPATVAGLLTVFGERRGWKLTTLSTILARLTDKGYLSKTMEGKANRFVPVLTLDEFRRLEAQSLLDTLYGGSVKSLVSALADGGGMTAHDLKALREWFDEQLSEEEGL